MTSRVKQSGVAPPERTEVKSSAITPKGRVTPDVEVRLAEDADGPAIGRLVVAAGFAVATLDWMRVHPWWLVAEREGRVAGCIQTCPALPIGRLSSSEDHDRAPMHMV